VGTRTLWHHTNDGVTGAVQLDALSDNRLLTAELTLPRPVAEHDDRRRATAIVIGRERSSE
jgi:hypothetical protein